MVLEISKFKVHFDATLPSRTLTNEKSKNFKKEGKRAWSKDTVDLESCTVRYPG